MIVLTFGWDFPPHTDGGLGFACHGLTSQLAQEGTEVIFVLPRTQQVMGPSRFVFADVEKNVRVREINSPLTPYKASGSSFDVYDVMGKRILYSRTILEEVHKYAHAAAAIALRENFDIIHAHDWTAYLAGVAAKIATKKPLVLHVHATSFDQAAGTNVDPEIYKIELEGFVAADCIVAVSQLTKDTVVSRYGIDPDKVTVVHNGSESDEPEYHPPTLGEHKKQGKKIVLYHGRITVQKGVDYFVRAAKRVLDVEPNVVFVVSGKGDMSGQIMEQVASLGLSQHFIFAGALWYAERDQMYQSADLVVMPSVSEPFGLVPLEAMRHGTPSVISHQSGVSEVMAHVLKVDFWDIDEMANKIIAALRYPVMNNQLVQEGKIELRGLTWRKAAIKIQCLYQRLVQLVRS
ncbi:MAG: glycogen(starch) synthase [Candidatus Azotimanducaceae bacterium]|jgi:glycogen(starch) synthase